MGLLTPLDWEGSPCWPVAFVTAFTELHREVSRRAEGLHGMRIPGPADPRF